MRPIELAPEPKEFEANVRTPGRSYIAKLKSSVGVEFRGHTYWTKAIPDLRRSYKCVCAYTSHWIAKDVGANSVDHFIPKSEDGWEAYEWRNLRLSSSRLNSRRGTRNIIDPFEVEDGMFVLDFASLYVMVGGAYQGNETVERTINILKLNDDICVQSRLNYVHYYAVGNVDDWLAAKAPFISYEVARQGISRADLIGMGFGARPVDVSP